MLMQIRNVILAWFVCSVFLVGCDLPFRRITGEDLASIHKGDYPVHVAQRVGKPHAVVYGENGKRVYWFYNLGNRIYSVSFHLQDGRYRTYIGGALRARDADWEFVTKPEGPPFDYGYD